MKLDVKASVFLEHLPIVDILENELEKFQTIWKIFGIEMQYTDELQLEFYNLF